MSKLTTSSCHITEDNFLDADIKLILCVLLSIWKRQLIKHMIEAYKNMAGTERMTRDCLTSGSSTTSLNGDDSKERGGDASHTRLVADLAQITERMKSLHLFRTDQTWEEKLLRVINTIKTICNQRNSWTANCWRQGEHFEEVPLCLSWFYTISGTSAFDLWSEAIEGWAVGLLHFLLRDTGILCIPILQWGKTQ